MKKEVNKIYVILGVKSERTKNITKHVLLSFIFKVGSILASFLLVPLTINFLDTENYGIWLTLSSFVAWFSFFDIGLGNGLRNKFAEAKATGNMTLAKGYVSSAYYTIGAVCLGLVLVFTGLNFFIDWTKVFNTSLSVQKDLNLLMPIVFGFFCLQLVVNLITTIYTADQHHSMQGKINFYTQVGSLVLIWVMTKTSDGSLLIFGTVFSALPVFLLLWLNFFAFNKRFKDFKPSISYWKKDYLKDIFGLGISFFVLQLAGIVIFSTDNVIISRLYKPSSVVQYNIAFKYFSIANMLFSIILAPYWSSITEAYAKKDFDWIKLSMKNLIKLSLGSVFVIAFMVLLSFWFYDFWIGEMMVIPLNLTLLMAIYFSIVNIYMPFTYFINGTGKIRLQMIIVSLMAIVNIPLAIYFAKNLNFGVSGVILASIVCLIPHAIVTPIQYFKLMKNHPNGIWNK